MSNTLCRLFVVLFIAACSNTAPAQTARQPKAGAAASATDPLSRCSTKLISYADWPKVRHPAFTLDLAGTAGRGHLYYFGAQHSTDPQAAQFAEIEAAWNKLKPTLAFYEGPNRPLAATREETIRQAGESGFVRFLATRDGVPFQTLEPSPADELAYVRRRFPEDQVRLFFILRETARLRERRQMGEPELRVAIQQLLERAAKMKLIGDAAPLKLEELDAMYRRYWSDPPNWWQAPQKWFDPIASSKETGGIFTNAVNRASSEFRNQHMFRLLAKGVAGGERVFAVVGRNHVPMQAGALRCALR